MADFQGSFGPWWGVESWRPPAVLTSASALLAARIHCQGYCHPGGRGSCCWHSLPARGAILDSITIFLLAWFPVPTVKVCDCLLLIHITCMLLMHGRLPQATTTCSTYFIIRLPSSLSLLFHPGNYSFVTRI
ncbi:hypothetical protein BU26DRAFT_305507 [Trematosphaeria pertusa]|uniref:Uncharacterized protein n=1 Tax=Trematosphaeria pertusa TaxID=390896 RepID=A0A6A6IED9_9PLEO|nr:uncharacterized protein BU26DRAFT_305507 [Trematosphaeria pertusa]KAF2248771.1 hypothetical protein BU26DRAFT_305507 [Trematosphaeria pertusa]